MNANLSFFGGFGLKDHTAAFTLILESQIGIKCQEDTPFQPEKSSEKESNDRKQKEIS